MDFTTHPFDPASPGLSPAGRVGCMSGFMDSSPQPRSIGCFISGRHADNAEPGRQWEWDDLPLNGEPWTRKALGTGPDDDWRKAFEAGFLKRFNSKRAGTP